MRPDDSGNHRDGIGGKTRLTDDAPLAIDVPCDCDGSFDPRLIAKHERRFGGFDGMILALYARSTTVSEFQGFLLDMYATDV